MAGNDVNPPPPFYAPLVMHAVKKWKNEADVVYKKPAQLAEKDLKCSNTDRNVLQSNALTKEQKFVSLRASFSRKTFSGSVCE